MKSVFVFITLFSSAAVAFNFNPQDYIKSHNWTVLMERLASEGESSDGGISELRALSQIFEIVPEKEHKSVFLTASGRTNIIGEYIVFEVSVSTEHWKLSEDGQTWHIDQWFYYMTSKGDLRYAVHNVLERSSGIIKSQKGPMDSAEEVEKSWSELMKLWLN